MGDKDYQRNLPEGVEARFVPFQEFRAEDTEDGTVIEGHAATFEEPYDVGPFKEKIAPGAFDGVLGDDVRALVDHDPSRLLGRASSGTLEVDTDERGLKARIQLPDTTDGRNVEELIRRGDLSEMSFGFEVESDTWEELDNGQELRTINSVKRLWDVSVVSFPANPSTDVALRSREAWKEQATEAREASAETPEDEPKADAPAEPMTTLTVRLDADAEELKRTLDELEAQAERIRETLGETRLLSQARTPEFDEPNPDEDAEWDAPDLEDYRSALGLDEGAEWEDLPESEREQVVAHTLIGEASADTFDEANAFPVVEPESSWLNANALRAAISRAPQADISEDTAESIQSVARDLLDEHFGDEDEENAADVATLKRKLRLAEAQG